MHAEKNLVKKAQEGDKQAFAEIYEIYYEPLLKYTLRKTNDHERSLDIVANTFLSVMDALPNFQWNDDIGIKPWIFRICSNEVNQYFRTKYKYKAKFSLQSNDESFQQIKSESMEQLEEYVGIEQIQKMRSIINNLPEEEQNLIELRFEHELSYKQIAAQTGEKIGTLRSKISRLLAKIKKEHNYEF